MTDYTPDPADVQLVNVAWKNATCHHFREGVCVSCGSVAILRALAGRWAPLAEVEELATELAEERILHQQTIAERDEARAEADRLAEELAWTEEKA